MKLKNYDELSSLELDTLREMGGMGTGNAATGPFPAAGAGDPHHAP